MRRAVVGERATCEERVGCHGGSRWSTRKGTGLISGTGAEERVQGNGHLEDSREGCKRREQAMTTAMRAHQAQRNGWTPLVQEAVGKLLRNHSSQAPTNCHTMSE